MNSNRPLIKINHDLFLEDSILNKSRTKSRHKSEPKQPFILPQNYIHYTIRSKQSFRQANHQDLYKQNQSIRVENSKHKKGIEIIKKNIIHPDFLNEYDFGHLEELRLAKLHIKKNKQVQQIKKQNKISINDEKQQISKINIRQILQTDGNYMNPMITKTNKKSLNSCQTNQNQHPNLQKSYQKSIGSRSRQKKKFPKKLMTMVAKQQMIEKMIERMTQRNNITQRLHNNKYLNLFTLRQ